MCVDSIHDEHHSDSITDGHKGFAKKNTEKIHNKNLINGALRKCFR